jgi:hypothetical protein
MFPRGHCDRSQCPRRDTAAQRVAFPPLRTGASERNVVSKVANRPAADKAECRVAKIYFANGIK